MKVYVGGARIDVDPASSLGAGGEADVYDIGGGMALKLFKGPRHPDFAGQPATLVGRVSMDMITVDLSDAPSAQVGDEVVLWGEGVPVEPLAAAAGTIAYELLCGVTQRVSMRVV